MEQCPKKTSGMDALFVYREWSRHDLESTHDDAGQMSKRRRPGPCMEVWFVVGLCFDYCAIYGVDRRDF